MSSPLRDNKVSLGALTDQAIQERLGGIIRNRPVKTVSFVTGLSEAAVKKWRLFKASISAPSLIRLIATDDEIFHAVMELAGRGNGAPVDMMLQRLEADLAELKAFAKGETTDASRTTRSAAGRLPVNRHVGEEPGRGSSGRD